MQIAASIISSFLSLYSLLIVFRIILSWGNIGELRFGSFYRMLCSITDPYLAIFRGIPGLQRGNLDFSPILAMILLGILNNIVAIVAAEGTITIGLILALIINATWSVISFFLLIFIVLAIARIVYEYYKSPNSIHYISILDNLLKGPQDRVHRLLFGGREMPIKTLLFGTAAALIIFRIALRIIFDFLTGYLAGLPF